MAKPYNARTRFWSVLLLVALFGACLSWGPEARPVSALAALVSLQPSSQTVAPGAVFDVQVLIQGVTNLSTVDLRINFDPAVLTVVDQDAGQAGVQILPGNIFPSDNPLFNQTDNTNGIINYSILGLVSGAFTGDGVIATVRFQALAAGTSDLLFDYLVLTDPSTAEIPVTGQGGQVTVSGGATETPTPTETLTPTLTATATETLTPTLTATATETVTPTLTATLTATETPTATLTLTATPTITTTATTTATATPTVTGTVPITGTATPTNTPTFVSLPLILKDHVVPPPTATPTLTPTPVPTPTDTLTPTVGPSPTPTFTPTATLTPSLTPTATETPLYTATPTVTPSPTVTPCENMVANGGAENDDAWHFPPTAHTGGYSTTHALYGLRSLRSGIEEYYDIGTESYSSAQQYVYVPLYSQQMRFSFWYYSKATGAPAEADWHYIIIIDQYGTRYFLKRIYWPETTEQVWRRVEFTEEVLWRFRGQFITLVFGTYNNGWGGAAAMWVDEVHFDVCYY